MRRIILTSLLVMLPSLVSAESLEDLLIEKGVITKEEARAAAHSGSSKVYWKGGTRLEFPDSGVTLKLNTQLQPRYEYTADDDSDNTSSFRMKRARLIASGTAMNKEFSYKLQADFVGRGDGDYRTPDLLEAYVAWHPCDDAGVRFGQFKTAVSRQFNTSSTKLQFPDRTAASDYFQLGRQQGVRAYWGMDSWGISGGVYNGESTGEGRNRPGVDTKHTAVVALRGNIGAEVNPYSEGDIERQDFGLNLGLNYAYSDAEVAIGEVQTQRYNFDATIKVAGLSVAGEFFYMNEDPDLTARAKPLGFYVQAGFLVTDKLEIAVRGGQTDCDDGAAGGDCSGLDKLTEAGASLNYFFWGHNLKAQLAYNYEDEEGVGSASATTDKVIFQLSAYL